MAEAILNHELREAVHTRSAGTRPQPRVAENAIRALIMGGFDIEGLYPKDVDIMLNKDFDLVVTVCDNAKETCPIFPRPVQAIHLPFHDPHGEPLASFVAVREEIRHHLVPAVRQALGL